MTHYLPLRDTSEGLECLVECREHWGLIGSAPQAALVGEGFCTACPVRLEPHDGGPAHGRCPCCGACWSLTPDALVRHLHPLVTSGP